MFKDNTLITAEQYHKLISHFGGQNNAFTSNDYTAYFELLPANQYPVALQVEAARMRGLLFDQHEIDTEKKVVQEERRQRTDDNPLAKAYETFLAQALSQSPKSRPVIGSMNDIESLQYDDLHQWYKIWYRPNNATLVLVGDVNPAQAMPWIKKYFADIKKAPLPTRNTPTHPTHTGYKKLELSQAVAVPAIIMGFNVPSITTNEADAYALAVFADVADGSASARFERNLVRTGLFSNIGTNFDLLQKGDGLFTIIATPSANVSLQEAEALILKELNAISYGTISDAELKRGQKQLATHLIFKSDSISEQARSLGMLSMLGLPLDTLHTLPKKLAQVDTPTLQQVAKRYLTTDNLTVAYVVNEDKQ